MQTVIGIDPGLNGAMALCVRQGDSVRVEAVVDDNAVCTSMLPVEQRKSFTGQP